MLNISLTALQALEQASLLRIRTSRALVLLIQLKVQEMMGSHMAKVRMGSPP
jgi:hypothetical protein